MRPGVGVEGGGVTQTRKGYRLLPDCCRTVAIASQHCEKGGAVQSL